MKSGRLAQGCLVAGRSPDDLRLSLSPPGMAIGIGDDGQGRQCRGPGTSASCSKVSILVVLGSGCRLQAGRVEG